MNATDYVNEKLDVLLEKFSGVSVRYAFEKTSHYHVVEIEPLEELKKNKEFLDFIMDFWFEFEDKFEVENLLISEKDEILNDMSNLLFESSDHSLEYDCLNDYFVEYLFSKDNGVIFEQEFLAA